MPRASRLKKCPQCGQPRCEHMRPKPPKPPVGVNETGKRTGNIVPVPEGLRRLLYEFHHGERGD